MQIQSLQNTNTSFYGWERTVYKKAKTLWHSNDGSVTSFTAKKVKHCNHTYFYRGSRGFWQKFTDLIGKKYKKVSKVNLYSYGCSNGEEPLTLMMQIMSNFSKNFAEKFFPIQAKDYDKKAIRLANSQFHDIDNDEIAIIDYFTNFKFTKFFEPVKEDSHKFHKYFDYKPNNVYEVKDEFAPKINYGIANIVKDVDNIESSNSIVFARNFWPYLSKQNVKFLAQKLYEKLDNTSLLVLGDYDKSLDAFEELKKAGFKQHKDIETVFFKP